AYPDSERSPRWTARRVSLSSLLVQLEPDAIRILHEADHVLRAHFDRLRQRRSGLQQSFDVLSDVFRLKREVVKLAAIPILRVGIPVHHEDMGRVLVPECPDL